MQAVHTALDWLHRQPLALWALATLLMFALSLGLSVWLIVRMPADVFLRERVVDPTPRGRLKRLARNTLGTLLIILGLVLSLPGVPGQGLLTVLLGLVLLDGRGKRKLELKLLQRPGLRRSINRLRQRYGREPLQLPDNPGEPA
jgi:hypothetical protein